MATSDNYAERFKSLRRREWLVIGLFVGYMPVVGALAWLVSRDGAGEGVGNASQKSRFPWAHRFI